MSSAATYPDAQPQCNGNHRPTPNDGRDCNGRFTAGNRGGPGNPFARRAAELRKAFQEAATPEDMRRVCQRLIAQAVLGDVPSIKLFLSYTLGKVPEPVNPDTVDHEEVRMHTENLTVSELAAAAQAKSPPRVSLSVLRAMTIVREDQALATLQKPDRAAERKEARREKRKQSRPAPAERLENELAEIDTIAGKAVAKALAEIDELEQSREPHDAPIANGSTGDENVPPNTNGTNGKARGKRKAPPIANGSTGKRKPSPLRRQGLSGRRQS